MEFAKLRGDDLTFNILRPDAVAERQHREGQKKKRPQTATSYSAHVYTDAPEILTWKSRTRCLISTRILSREMWVGPV